MAFPLLPFYRATTWRVTHGFREPVPILCNYAEVAEEAASMIRLNMFAQSGLKPDDLVVVKHVTDYIMALLCSDEVRREVDEYKVKTKEPTE